MSLNRRDLLGGAPLAAAALAAPRSAAAFSASDEGAARAASLRDRWAAAEATFAPAVLGIEDADAGPAHRITLETLRRGVCALDIAKELEALAPLEQVRLALQALWRDVLLAVGRASEVSGDALEAWLDGAGAEGDPDGRHLHGVLGAMRIGFRDASTRESRREMIDRSFAALLDDPDPGKLRFEARRALRRQRKAEVLARHLADDPEALRRHLGLDPARAAELGLDAIAEPQETLDQGLTSDERASVVLGMMGLGVLVVAGVLVSVLGLCAALCGSPVAGILVLLAGVGLITLGILGIVRLKRWRKARQQEGGEASAPEVEGLQPQPLDRTWASVPAGAGWVDAVQVRPDRLYVCQAWGLSQGDRAWPADADGDGVAAGKGAPLPGAPALGLIGRVGDRTFFIGAERALPSGLEGMLQLGVNRSTTARGAVRGGLSVQILEVEIDASARGAA